MTPESFDTLLKVGSNLSTGAILLGILYFLYKNAPKWIDRHFTLIGDLTAVFQREIKEERTYNQQQNERLALLLERSNTNTVQAFQALNEKITEHYAISAELSRRVETEILARRRHRIEDENNPPIDPPRRA